MLPYASLLVCIVPHFNFHQSSNILFFVVCFFLIFLLVFYYYIILLCWRIFQYHPDKNKDARAQDKFVRIVEAYNVLSKPSSRARYDSLTEIETSGPAGASYAYRTHVSYK